MSSSSGRFKALLLAINYSSLFIDKQTLLYLQHFQMCTIWEQRSKKNSNLNRFQTSCDRLTSHEPIQREHCARLVKNCFSVCFAFPALWEVHKKQSSWIINNLSDVLVRSIAEYFYELCRILTHPADIRSPCITFFIGVCQKLIDVVV